METTNQNHYKIKNAICNNSGTGESPVPEVELFNIHQLVKLILQ